MQYAISLLLTGLVRSSISDALGTSDGSANHCIAGAQASVEGYRSNVSPDRSHHLAVSYAKSTWIGSLCYPLACGFPKLSICVLYLRIFTSPRLRLVTWVMIVFLSGNMTAFFVAQIFYCNPPSYYWNSYAIETTARKHLNNTQCIDNEALTLAINPPHIFSDLVLFILPMPMVWRLQATRTRKFALAIIFFLATIGIVSCTARWIQYLTTQGDVSISKRSHLLHYDALSRILLHLQDIGD